jgi:hypothetical protein
MQSQEKSNKIAQVTTKTDVLIYLKMFTRASQNIRQMLNLLNQFWLQVAAILSLILLYFTE